jgi:modulator of FtsH protease
MSPESLAEWQAHLSMEAGAAATLLGLVFVAASINLKQIVVTPSLPGRVVETVAQFVQVLFISMMITIPRQPERALAVEILVVALCSWGMQMVGFARYRQARLGYPGWWLIVRILQTHLAAIPFVVGGVLLWLRFQDALYWVVPGFFFSFFAGLVNSWVLLINVGRRGHATQPNNDHSDSDA